MLSEMRLLTLSESSLRAEDYAGGLELISYL